MKKNNSLLITILSGAIFCFVCLGMVLLFPGNTKKLKSEESPLPNAGEHGYVDNEGISLGDATDGCTDWEEIEESWSCSSGTLISGACYSGAVAWDGMSSTTCYSAGGNYIANQTCYRSRSTPTHYPAETKCTACDQGKYLTNNACAVCPAGSYCSGGTAQLATCPAGTYSTGGARECSQCNGSKEYSGSGASSCSTCANGQVANSSHTGCDEGVFTCPGSYYADTGASTYSQCYKNVVAGYSATWSGGSHTISACTGNTYSSSRKVYYGQSSECTPCDGTVNADKTECVVEKSCASISGSTECTARSDCAWDYTYGCQNKPKPCGDYGNLTDCNNAGCSWSYDGNYCEAKKQVLTSITGGGNAYVTPDTCKTFHLQAKDADGKIVSASWTVSGAHQTNSCTSGSGVCSVTVCGWTCPATGTVSVSASYNGVTKSTSIRITSYEKWNKTDWNNVPNNNESAYIYDSTSLDHNVCYGYSDPYVENGVTKYKNRYTRCCGSGGGTPVTPTPEAPHCYVDSDEEYHWTTSPESSWKIVDTITKEADCKKEEKEACYKKPSGEYVWGKYAKEDGYTLITVITDSALCKKPTDEACYKKENDYKWTSTPPEGYTKVDGVTKPEDCAAPESPACYLHENNFIWGKYEKITGYIFVENISDEKDCKTPDVDACYVDSKGDYVWGKYGNTEGYTLVPSVTEMSQCKNNVPVPKTGISISKIIYIFMAILMAFGVGFIYYSSAVKKND